MLIDDIEYVIFRYSGGYPGGMVRRISYTSNHH